MITKTYLEELYRILLEEAKYVPYGSVDDERLDAKLCLIEELLEE